MSNSLQQAAASLRRVGIAIDRDRTANRRVIVISQVELDSVTTVTDRDDHARQAHQTDLLLTDSQSTNDEIASRQSALGHFNPRMGPVH